jgi:hypothetical protein
MSVIIGKPEEPKPDERNSFYVHKNLLCYIDIQPDGVYVEGKGPKGHEIFRRHFQNMHQAMGFIEHKREVFAEGDDKAEDSKQSG